MIPDFVRHPDPQLYRTGTWLALDFETSNLDRGSALNKDNRLVLSCWSMGKGATTWWSKYQWGDEFNTGELLEDIKQCDFILAQNGKFELQWLDRCGHEKGTKPLYDTMMGEWVLSGNRAWPLDLDSLAAKYGARSKSRLIKLLLLGGVSPELIPRSLLLKYCIEDVANTVTVMHGQLAAMEGTRLLPVVYTRCLTTLVLADIEKSGICLDPAEVEVTYNKTVRALAEVNREVDGITGGINMGSSKQLSEFLYDTLQFKEVCDPRSRKPIRTAKGQRSTSADVVARLVASTAGQRRFVELRQTESKLRAAVTKNLEFFLGVCKEYGGIFYGQIRQGVARTHRLASSGSSLQFKMFKKPKSCQFQNLPNQFKRLITARHPGWLVCEGDGSQLEFRVAGHLGNDKQIKADVTNKEDIHSHTAKTLTAAGEPTNRREAKASTFKPLYGGTKGSKAVEEYCKFFAEKYHGINTVQRNWALKAFNNGFIETEWGLRYYFPDLRMARDGHIQGQQQVFNYPVQGFATGEIIPIGLIFFWYRTMNADLIITNTVHDSIICEVPPWEIELFQLAIVQSLTLDVYDYLNKCYDVQFSLPLGVGIKMGTHWGTSAFTDEELQTAVQPLVDAGFSPVVDDGEVAVDVPIQ